MRRAVNPLILGIVAAAFSATASLLTGKLFNVWGLQITAGLFNISLFFVILDMVNELYGKKVARSVLTGTLIGKILLYSYIWIVASVDGIEIVKGFDQAMLFAVKAAFVSEIAIYISNYFIDVPIFDFLKRFRGGFFLRTNATNVISGVLSTLMFMTVVYWGKTDILPLFTGQVIVRMVMALALSPVAALFVRGVKMNREERTDEQEE